MAVGNTSQPGAGRELTDVFSDFTALDAPPASVSSLSLGLRRPSDHVLFAIGLVAMMFFVSSAHLRWP